jgi:hypothetical protein
LKLIAWWSTLLAFVIQVRVGQMTWPRLSVICLVVAVCAAVIGRWRRNVAIIPIVLTLPVAPAVISVAIGHFYSPELTVWLAAVVGLLLVRGSLGQWQLPKHLVAPLSLWAGVVAFSWPVIALREFDFDFAVLGLGSSVSGSRSAGLPLVTVGWVASVAFGQIIGILWYDWLYAEFRDRPNEFRRVVVWPITFGAALAGMHAAYQGFVDLRFVSAGAWPTVGRASGALLDANASGTFLALAFGPTVALAVGGKQATRVLAIALSCLMVVGTLVTGSRTAALALGVSFVVIAVRLLPVRLRGLQWIFGAVVVSAILTLSLSSVTGPAERIAELLPSLSARDVRRALVELWERNGYGRAAVWMIREYPLAGIGVGSFHQLAPDFFYERTTSVIPPDNAQNWYRHQLAELGLLGSVGWIAWTAILGGILLRTFRSGRPQGVAFASAAAGFGIASLLGMPGQNISMALMFWVCCFGFATGVPTDVGRIASITSRSWRVALVLLLGSHVALTSLAATDDLRVPHRAARFGFDYAYGFYPDHNGHKWTGARAVAVPYAPTNWVKLSAWVLHPDADRHPVEVDVWVDGKRITHRKLPRNIPILHYVRLPSANRRFVLEVRVARTFSPEGCADPKCERGLEMQWEFVKSPPR